MTASSNEVVIVLVLTELVLQILGTVGEPINPEAWKWYDGVVGEGRCPVVDTWWQVRKSLSVCSTQWVQTFRALIRQDLHRAACVVPRVTMLRSLDLELQLQR
jgi:hypothetical protein